MLTPSRGAGGGSDLTIERTGRAQYRAGYGAVESRSPCRPGSSPHAGPGSSAAATSSGSWRPSGSAWRREPARSCWSAASPVRARPGWPPRPPACCTSRASPCWWARRRRTPGCPTSRSPRCWTTCSWRASPARWTLAGELRLLSRHAAPPPPRPRPSRSATAAATCSRPSPNCSGRSPATGRWSSSSTTCTGRSCRPSRCSSTWSTPAWTPRRWWWRTFRTTAPDRSDELSARLADLHRLDGVRRLDLAGLDTEAIAEFVCEHAGVSSAAARASAAILRDRTGGNPFFLRETWLDLERSGGVAALRGPQRVPVTLGDTVAARLAGLGGAAAGDRRAGRGDRRRVRPVDAGRGRHGRPGHEHGRGRRRGRGRPARTGGRYGGPLRVRPLADPAGRARPAVAHPLHGAARPGGADAGGPRRPRADAADRAPLPRGARPRLPRAGVAARDGGRVAGRAQPGVRGGGAVVRPGRVPAGDAGGASARSCRSRPRRTTCARATSPGPGASTSG